MKHTTTPTGKRIKSLISKKDLKKLQKELNEAFDKVVISMLRHDVAQLKQQLKQKTEAYNDAHETAMRSYRRILQFEKLMDEKTSIINMQRNELTKVCADNAGLQQLVKELRGTKPLTTCILNRQTEMPAGQYKVSFDWEGKRYEGFIKEVDNDSKPFPLDSKNPK